MPERDLFWRMRGERALRRGDLKYVRLPETGEALYNIGSDPCEVANLSAARPPDLSALRAAWQAIDAKLLPYPA